MIATLGWVEEGHVVMGSNVTLGPGAAERTAGAKAASAEERKKVLMAGGLGVG